MKILFLDVDGVLNNAKTNSKVDTVFGKFTGLDQSLVNRLLSWLSTRDVKIVLSSSWRLDERYDHAFTNTLRQAGINWIAETPNEGHRGKDIAAWLDRYEYAAKITHWAILDDISDVSPVGKGLVQTSPHRGLEDKHLEKLDVLLDIRKGNKMEEITNQMAQADQHIDQVELQAKAAKDESIVTQGPENVGEDTTPVVI